MAKYIVKYKDRNKKSGDMNYIDVLRNLEFITIQEKAPYSFITNGQKYIFDSYSSLGDFVVSMDDFIIKRNGDFVYEFEPQIVSKYSA